MKRTSHGSVLIVVLFVMIVLSLLTVSFAYRAGLESRSVRHRAITARLKVYADSAMTVATARIEADKNDFDHRAEPWGAHRGFLNEDWLPLTEVRSENSPLAFEVDYAVIDEEGKLHVTRASSKAMEQLGLSNEQIGSLLDWMDQDDNPRPDGAESSFYTSLKNPYRCKNQPIEHLDELLLVRGFNSDDYWGEDADHDGELDANENDGSISFPLDNADGALQSGLVDLLTAYGEGRINLNTTSFAVLDTLPLSKGAARQIESFRRFDRYSAGNIEDHIFRSAEELAGLQGLTQVDMNVLAQVGAYQSAHFRVIINARELHSGIQLRCEAVLRRGDDGVEILSWRTGV